MANNHKNYIDLNQEGLQSTSACRSVYSYM